MYPILWLSWAGVVAAAALLLHVFKYFSGLGNVMNFHQRCDLIIAAYIDRANAHQPLEKALPQLDIRHAADGNPVNLFGKYAALCFHAIRINKTTGIAGT